MYTIHTGDDDWTTIYTGDATMTHENKPLCAACGKPFRTAEDWADRHWTDDDYDAEYHAECCPACVAEDSGVEATP